MFLILKDTEKRLVMTLGDRSSRWTKYVLDKEAGYAWFERGRRFLPPQTLTVRLTDIAAIESRTVGRGRKSSDNVVVTTSAQVRLRLIGETGHTQEAVARMRKFIDLNEAAPQATGLASPLATLGMRAGQVAAVLVAGLAVVWVVAQAGGLVANAAAKAGDLVTRGAGHFQNRFLLPACDAAESRDAIQELVRDRLGSSAVLADVAQRGQSADERLCTATARRGTQTASVSYRNYWDGWTPKVRLTGEIVTLKLDAARTVAIDEAIGMLLSSSQGSSRTGNAPRQSDQAIDKALATVFGASDLATEPLAPAEIDRALAWLKAADRVGAVYLLAGTGYDDFTKVPRTDAIQRRMRSNVVAFASEYGRYADFQMVLLAAVANAQMRATTSGKPNSVQANADDVREQLAQAIRSNLIALVYEGHNDGWRMARLTALGRTAPVAAKFLSKDEAKALRDLALQTVDYFKDITVRAKARDVAATLSAP
jgi:hypothetical protein